MKEIIQIKENCLYLNDLERARIFYTEILELEVIHYQPEKHIFFKAGASVLLCFNPEDSKQKTSPPGHFAKGNQHFAFEVSPEDYEPVKEMLVKKGVIIIDSQLWPGQYESFYFNDPEMNVLEIVPKGVWD